MKLSVGLVCGAGIVSGKEIMALELAQGLRARGHAPAVVTSSWNNGQFIPRLRALGVPVREMAIGFMAAQLNWRCVRMTAIQIWKWPRLLAGYRAFLRETRPARVIHTSWNHIVLVAPFLRADRDIFWIHESVPNAPRYRRLFRFLGRRVVCFVPVSEAVARTLRDIGVPEEKIRVIHNGLKDPATDSVPTASVPGAVRVGIGGQIGVWKGYDDLWEAFALAARSRGAAELHVFGKGDEAYEAHLKRRAEELGIQSKLRWHGFVADRAAIYRGIDIWTVPSRSNDPLPTTAIEAAFFGLPIVATLRGGLPEIVREGVTGYLVDAGDTPALANRLGRLIDDAALRRRMGAAARVDAAERFGRDRFVTDFENVLGAGDAARFLVD